MVRWLLRYLVITDNRLIVNLAYE